MQKHLLLLSPEHQTMGSCAPGNYSKVITPTTNLLLFIFLSRRPRHLPVPAGAPGLLGAAAAPHRPGRVLPRGPGLGHPQEHRLQLAQGGVQHGRAGVSGVLFTRLNRANAAQSHKCLKLRVANPSLGF